MIWIKTPALPTRLVQVIGVLTDVHFTHIDRKAGQVGDIFLTRSS